MNKPTKTASLLYWLLVVCGLAGLTVVRNDAPHDLVALWGGSLAGIAFGQLTAFARVRAWVFVALAVASVWVAPVFVFVLYDPVRPAAEMLALALLPAFVSGYLSLSERWGLASFWYPAMLWMLVVLDGPGRFDAAASAPLLVGLAGLFVAFLRARETRRTVLWRTHAVAGLAKQQTRVVLRSAPGRAAVEHLWTGSVALGALLLAAAIGPQLWQRGQDRRAAEVDARNAALSDAIARQHGGSTTCCKTAQTPQARVREYFTPRRTVTDEDRFAEQSAALTCRVCDGTEGSGTLTDLAADEGNGTGTGSGSGTGNGNGPGSGIGGGIGGIGGGGQGLATGHGWEAPTTPDAPPFAGSTSATSPSVHAPGPGPLAGATPVAPLPPGVPTTHHEPGLAAAGSPSVTGASAPVVVVNAPIVTPRSAEPERAVVNAPPPADDVSWATALLAALAAFGSVVAFRVVRRTLRLRHLARPFWRETTDQRISNHWERMLVGLRDAGIHTRPDEQPQALATRVRLPGLETCATILERVRHGLRIEAADLDAMARASDEVFRAARARTGVLARAAALMR